MSGTLVRQMIRARIEKENLIENADLKESLSPASYELRVGSYYDWNTNMRIDLQQGEAIAGVQANVVEKGTKKVNLLVRLCCNTHPYQGDSS